jgi:hypothetical protein
VPVIANTILKKLMKIVYRDPLTGEMLPIDENNLIIPLNTLNLVVIFHQTFKTTEVRKIESKATV